MTGPKTPRNGHSTAIQFPMGDTDAFPGNWVEFYGDYCTDGVWSAGGLSCSADDLPITQGLREKIQKWAFTYFASPHPRDTLSEAGKKWFDEVGLSLARKLKGELPHWTVAFLSASGAYRTPAGKTFGLVMDDGSFADLTAELLELKTAISREEHGF